jgi:membrane protein DedA with SNARE-associated domain
MARTLEFLVAHGYLLLFAFALAEQLGLPLPAIPVLLAAGALAAHGRMSLALVLAVAVLAALIGDLVWYALGRVKGGKVLSFLCRISLEPDSCVRRTEDVFARHGARSLLVAKFVPGLSTVAPPLAGIFGMPPARFLLFDAAGSLAWVGAYTGLGWLFADELERVAEVALGLGARFAVLVGLATALFLVVKYERRRRFLRSLRIARIAPEELKARLDAGEPVVVIDLRSSPDFEAAPYVIPGAFRSAPDELEARAETIPRDREVVLYCT